jgi:hypothetical protein
LATHVLVDGFDVLVVPGVEPIEELVQHLQLLQHAHQVRVQTVALLQQWDHEREE